MAENCAKCHELRDLASLATIRHMRALTRLEVAELRRELAAIPDLRAALSETCRERMKATEAFQAHAKTHASATTA